MCASIPNGLPKRSTRVTDDRRNKLVVVPWRALGPLVPPYFLFGGLAYQLAYWSQFGVPVLEYASLGDLINLSLYPFVLSLQPIAVVTLMVWWWYGWANPRLEPRPGAMPIVHISHEWIRGAVRALLVLLVIVVAATSVVGALLMMNGAIRNESWSWLLFGAIVALAVKFPPPGASLKDIRMFGRGSIALSRTGMALLALLPFVSYGIGLRSAEVALRRSEIGWVDQLLAVPSIRCAIFAEAGRPPVVASFLGHVNEYDFFLLADEVIALRSEGSGRVHFTKCGR